MQRRVRWWFFAGWLVMGAVMMGCPSQKAPVRSRPPSSSGDEKISPDNTDTPSPKKSSTENYSPPRDKNCVGLDKTYGYSIKDPIEPGVAGMRMGRRVLWRCPSGVIARMHRIGNVGKARYTSKSPLVGAGFDIVDLWQVTCPKLGQRRVYVNAYRKGHGCAPPPYTTIPRQAFLLRTLAFQYAKHKRYPKALRAINRALRLTGDLALFLQTKAIILLYANQFTNAATALKKVLSMRSGAQPSNRLLLGIIYLKMGKYRKYSNILDFLLLNVSYQHKIYANVLCRKAMLLRITGHPSPAQRMAKQSCQMGEKQCC